MSKNDPKTGAEAAPSPASAGGQLSGSVLFYSQPEPLHPGVHGKLGVNRTDAPYGFVATTHVVPLTVTEFAAAALSYPVVFIGENRSPLAVMGLRAGENLYVSAQGQFRQDAYIPAFVRRYPFVFANDDNAKRMILCIDRNAPFVSENADVPLFDGDKPSAYTEQAMKFCNDFEAERRRTDAFVKLLTDLDLLVTREAKFTPRNPDGTAGEPQKIADYYAVSEERLNALPQDKFIELRDNGALAQIYAHLISLLGWDRLVALAFERMSNQPMAANA